MGAHHERRAAEPARQAAHQARARRVGVHHVGAETPRGPRERGPSSAQAHEAHRRLNRIEAQAGLEGGESDALDCRLVEQLGQRP